MGRTGDLGPWAELELGEGGGGGERAGVGMAARGSRRPAVLFLALLALLVAVLCLGGAAAQDDCSTMKGRQCKKSLLCVKSGKKKSMTCTPAVTPEEQCAAVQKKKGKRKLCTAQPVSDSTGSCACSKKKKCGACVYVPNPEPTPGPPPSDDGVTPIAPDAFDLPSDSD